MLLQKIITFIEIITVVWYQTMKNNHNKLFLLLLYKKILKKDNNNVLLLFFIVWYQSAVMISINVIIFCNYMFCEVYKSHPWRHGYPPDIRQISGAAMNLNRPYCETTNQMTFWRTSNHRRGILSICLEKVHFVRTFTFLKKCEYCSLFALFSTSANEQFVLIRVRVRTFLFALSRTNGNPSLRI